MQVLEEAIGPLLGQRADHWTRLSPPNKATRIPAGENEENIAELGPAALYLAKPTSQTRSQSSQGEQEVLAPWEVDDMPRRDCDEVEIWDCTHVQWTLTTKLSWV